ncbi:MAG: 50S ribosomal protein L25, partial [Patescibacteria group bacterium]
MDLLVEKRTIFGKKTRVLRKQGLIPAELYGHGLENLHFSISAKNFHKALKEAGERSIVNLVSDNQKRQALIHHI